MNIVAKLSAADKGGIAVFLILWGGSVLYLAATGGDWTFPLISLSVFGAGLSAVAWLTTRGVAAISIPVARPKAEAGALIIFLALYAVLFLGYGLGAAREVFPPGPAQEVFIISLKLVVHVGIPALILVLLGASIRPLFHAGVKERGFWLTLIVLGAIIIGLLAAVSPSLKNIAALNPTTLVLMVAIPLGFLSLAIEAGFCEEFLFRAVLQTRMTALFNSAWAGVILTSILFGLAHAPGLYLRGGPGVDGWSEDPLQVVAYTIATLSPLSLFFGFLYARTKSLLLVVLLHASVDVLPNTPEFIRTWITE